MTKAKQFIVKKFTFHQQRKSFYLSFENLDSASGKTDFYGIHNVITVLREPIRFDSTEKLVLARV